MPSFDAPRERLSQCHSLVRVAPFESDAWFGKRVIVTGGGGFLGRVVVAALQARGAAEVFAPRRREYDLREPDAVRRLLTDTSTLVRWFV